MLLFTGAAVHWALRLRRQLLKKVQRSFWQEDIFLQCKNWQTKLLAPAGVPKQRASTQRTKVKSKNLLNRSLAREQRWTYPFVRSIIKSCRISPWFS